MMRHLRSLQMLPEHQDKDNEGRAGFLFGWFFKGEQVVTTALSIDFSKTQLQNLKNSVGHFQFHNTSKHIRL